VAPDMSPRGRRRCPKPSSTGLPRRAENRRIVAQPVVWAYEPGDTLAGEGAPLDLAAPQPHAAMVGQVVPGDAVGSFVHSEDAARADVARAVVVALGRPSSTTNRPAPARDWLPAFAPAPAPVADIGGEGWAVEPTLWAAVRARRPVRPSRGPVSLRHKAPGHSGFPVETVSSMVSVFGLYGS
jgi:hypothetical protein